MPPKRKCRVCGEELPDREYTLCLIHRSETKLCNCGCGEIIPKYKKDGKIRKCATGNDHTNRLIKKNMEDSEYANRISQIRRDAALKLYEDRPELKDVRREQMLERLEDPGYIEQLRQQQTERWADPEEREKQRQRQLKAHKDSPELTKIKRQASVDYWEDNDEARQAQAERMSEMWEDDEFAQKMSDVHKGNTYGHAGKGIPKPRSFVDAISGPNNPNWGGGTSYGEYPQEFDNRLKWHIRRRQNLICADSKQGECVEADRALDVHHIDEDKHNNDPSNLIALCVKHHKLAHYNESSAKRYKKYNEQFE